jgi:parallel beta-helix repeat protein
VGFEKGIYLVGTHDAEILNNTVINQSYIGIHAVDSNNSRFVNNTMSNTYYGMYLEDARYNTIINTSVEDTFYAFYLNDSTNYNIMTNSLINDSTYGFYFFNSPNNSITNNTLIDVYTESDGVGSSPIYSENNLRQAAGGLYNMPEFNASTLLLSLAFVGVALTIMRRKRVA